MSASDTINVWKCLVLPGVDETATRVTPIDEERDKGGEWREEDGE